MQQWRAAALFVFLVTVPLWLMGGAWAWYQGYSYPEGLPQRLLITWSFAFVVLTLATAWGVRRS